MRKRGTTLIELLMACSLLMLIMGALFAVFELGTGAFRVSVLRQDLQSKARQVLGRLERELGETCLEALSVEDGPTRSVTVDGASLRRHVLCLATLADWNDLTSYDTSSGAPRWNRYVLYHATKELPQGRLMRTELTPPTVMTGPWGGFATLTFPDGPLVGPVSGVVVERSIVVAEEVFDFGLAPDGKALLCSLRLRRQDPSRLGGQKGRDEVYQLDVEARPRNPLT